MKRLKTPRGIGKKTHAGNPVELTTTVLKALNENIEEAGKNRLFYKN